MIDRKQLVARHFPVLKQIEPLSPLSVGNGNFSFSADFTGLQTFPQAYKTPLGTQSHWGWHSTGGPGHYTEEDIVFQKLDTYGRPVLYPLYPEGEETAYHWLRQNPHRLQLGQIGFRLFKTNQKEAEVRDIHRIEQTLDLWEGVLKSTFMLEGDPVTVQTVCHPELDQIGVKVLSPLIGIGRLQLSLHFPSPDIQADKWEEATRLDWHQDPRHHTVQQNQTEKSVTISRILDEDHYQVKWNWDHGKLVHSTTHEFLLYPEAGQAEWSFALGFAPRTAATEAFSDTYEKSARSWSGFWQSGGAVDFSGSTDPRAAELERRVILSQFLTALHSAGPIPPQETGLMYNSWFGKIHLEMHWWHAAHFPLWGRPGLLAKSMDWYHTILPEAKALAASQDYQGARWPKMTGPDGKQSPSPIAPALIWQQPHPVMLAELCYRADRKAETLKRWKEIIIETADFMASFAVWDQTKQAYVLGPPLIPSQENHKPEDSLNPPYELEYWKYGLETAAKWLERLGETPDSKWLEVAGAIAEPPQKDGVYLAHENCPATFTAYKHDHPSMAGAFGVLPGSMIDKKVMARTLERIREEWDWESAWGWDFPMCAMTAARLGDGEGAVDFLLMEKTKNTYLINGHNYQHPALTAYLPGNGGLLSAVAMMICGWRGAERKDMPGFPKDGTWQIQWEGLHPVLP